MLQLLLSTSLSLTLKASVYYDGTTFTVKDGVYDPMAYSRALFEDNVAENGWHDLEIECRRDYEDILSARAAGYVEAYLTHELYKNFSNNIKSHLCSKYVICANNQYPDTLRQFIQQNLDWVMEQQQSYDPDDPYYFGVNMTINQMEGLIMGYNSLHPDAQITMYDLWELYMHTEIPILARILGVANQTTKDEYRRGTVIIGKSDPPTSVFFGQNAWRSYGDAIRIAKRYRLRFHSNLSTVDRRTISSYPFMLFSDDHFQISDNGLLVMSSFLKVSDECIQNAHNDPKGYPSWLRHLGATFSSTSAQTYDIEYKAMPLDTMAAEFVVVDIKKFDYGHDFHDNFVAVIDEIPGHHEYADMTNTFMDQRFFESVDVPHVQTIFDAAGYPGFGDDDWFSLLGNVRWRILKVEAQTVPTIEEMKKLIRYNKPVSEPKQNGTTTKTLAGRFEIDKTIPVKLCFGAIDAKATSVDRMLHLEWEGAVGAPFNNELPKLFLSNCDACDNEAKDGVDDEMAEEWSSHYFDIGF